MKTASNKLFDLTSGVKYDESTGNYYVNEDQFSTQISPSETERSQEENKRLVDNFKKEGKLTTEDLGLSSNSKIGYKSGTYTIKNVVLNNGKLTFTLADADGDPSIEGAKKAITQTINITDTAALKNVLKLNLQMRLQKDYKVIEKLVVYYQVV